MLSRVVLPVGALAMSVPVVNASKTPCCDFCDSKKTLKPSQLSLYDEPTKPDLVYIPEPSNAYTDAISTGRKRVWKATEGMQGTICTSKAVYHLVKDYLRDARKHIQEDSSGLQRAALITVGGFGGIVAGYRGGMLRKAVLGSAAMTTAAAVCYPNQAVDISANGLHRMKEEALIIWDKLATAGTHKDSTRPKKAVPKNEANDAASEAPTSSSTSPAEDPGQSRPEDKDLYASRT